MELAEGLIGEDFKFCLRDSPVDVGFDNVKPGRQLSDIFGELPPGYNLRPNPSLLGNRGVDKDNFLVYAASVGKGITQVSPFTGDDDLDGVLLGWVLWLYRYFDAVRICLNLILPPIKDGSRTPSKKRRLCELLAQRACSRRNSQISVKAPCPFNAAAFFRKARKEERSRSLIRAFFTGGSLKKPPINPLKKACERL